MKTLAALLLMLLCVSAVQAHAFNLTSPDIADARVLGNAQVLKGHGCVGANLSPALNWANAPAGAKSFAVTVYDPDAPTGSGWWHWVVFDIPATATGLPAGAGTADGRALPQGSIQSRTDFGQPGFGGACPPKGDAPHRYQFTVYALDVPKLGLDPNASAALVGFMLRQHTLAKASILSLYQR